MENHYNINKMSFSGKNTESSYIIIKSHNLRHKAKLNDVITVRVNRVKRFQYHRKCKDFVF